MTPSVSPARACAYVVVRRVFEAGAWADRALHAEAQRHKLAGRERALAMQLAYGTVQRQKTIDHLIEMFAGRRVDELQAPVLAGLRLGLFQLCWLDRIPAHAAVGESVELVKAQAPRAAGLVNAVLRRAAGQGRELVSQLPEATPQQAALRHSHPEWVAQMWWDALGPTNARALMAAHNHPAEGSIRVNTLRATREELIAAFGPTARPAPDLAEGIMLDGQFDVFARPEWESGLLMPQSRAAMAVARILAPRPGERVLDLCAAPGGKTTHIAALMENRGEVLAVERHPGRAQALTRTVQRMGADCVTVNTGDARELGGLGQFDRVLVDPPCSDLGTLASRPDARWRKDLEDVERLSRIQAEILRAGAAALAPGGTLVYSTCTISPDENELLVGRFLTEHGNFEAVELRSDLPVWEHPSVPEFAQTLPHRDGTEGFFYARLRRSDAA